MSLNFKLKSILSLFILGAVLSTQLAAQEIAGSDANWSPHGNYGAESDCVNGNCTPRYLSGSAANMASNTANVAGNIAVGAAKRSAYYGTTGLRAANATGDCNYAQYGPHDLFRQYYVGNNCGGPPAEMYPAPTWVPPHVGHTYYTYQPLYPHEFLYPHKKTYHRYYDDGRGLTRTKVRWVR